MTEPVHDAVIDLDYNATAPLRPEALAAIAEAYAAGGNPASLHARGRAARRVLLDCRAALRRLCGAPKAEVVLTSGGTEADHLGVVGLARASRQSASHRRRILLSGLEHPAVLAAVQTLVSEGFVPETLPITAAGQLDLAALASALGDDVALVALMLAHNETGIVQPVRQAAALAAAYAVPLHCDAVQAAGKVAFDGADLGATTLAISAHKFGGPRGIGALLVADGWKKRLTPLYSGGPQEAGLRPGTPAVPLAAGMAAAAVAALTDGPRVAALGAQLADAVLALPGAAPVGPTAGAALDPGVAPLRLPNTLSVRFVDTSAAELVARASDAGVAISAGAACHAGGAHVSPALVAMGLSPREATEVVRLSLGWASTAADIEQGVGALASALTLCRRDKAA